MSDLKPVSYRIPLDLKAAVKDRAAELDLDQSEFVRQALRKALTLEKGLFEPTTRLRRGRGRRAAENGSVGVSERPAADGSSDGGSVLEGAGRSEAPRVNLPLVLSVRTGMPKSVMAQRVRAGRVSVNGLVVTEERVALSTGDVVALDGEAVVW